jgi:uncharacterized FlaG/YvyC family protein
MISTVGASPAMDPGLILGQTVAPAPAGAPPVPQAPALQQTVAQALDAQAAAAEKATEQADKAQAAMIDRITSHSGPQLTFRPSQVHFERDMETGRVAVEVYDALTGEKTGQVPSEQLMRTMEGISRQIGLLLDKTG